MCEFRENFGVETASASQQRRQGFKWSKEKAKRLFFDQVFSPAYTGGSTAKIPPNLLQRMQLRTVFRVTFCRHRRRLRAVSLYIFKFSEERARARTRVVNFVSRVFRWTSSLKPLKFLFRREKEAYNRMLRQEADHMRARGPQARVGTFSRLL